MKELQSASIDAIRDLVHKGQKKGFLTYKEIADALGQVELSSQQIDDIYKRFEDLGIEVISVKKDPTRRPAILLMGKRMSQAMIRRKLRYLRRTPTTCPKVNRLTRLPI